MVKKTKKAVTKKPTVKKSAAKKTKKDKKLTKAEMRVVIAKDVISALNSKRIKATKGSYFGVDFNEQDRWRNKYLTLEATDNEWDTLPKVPITLPKKCNVCAIGSVFVAAVDRFDKLTPATASNVVIHGDDYAMVEQLKPWFSEKQLRLMEVVFEGKSVRWVELIQYEEERNAIDMHYEIVKGIPLPHIVKKADVLMRAIMKNIIKNKGTFVIPS